LTGLLLNVTSRSVGTDSKSILDYMGVPISVGLAILVLSGIIGSYNNRKEKIEMSGSDFTIMRDDFALTSVANLKVDFNDNHAKSTYGERNYANGGKNFIRFINDKEAYEYEFFIPTNTEEQKLRKLVQSWAQPQS
jgi:hypothetical protein